MFSKMKNALNVFFWLSFTDGDIKKVDCFYFKFTTEN